MNGKSKVRIELVPFSQIETGHADDQYIRLTPKGERLAARLSKQTPRERERTMREIQDRVRRGQADLKNERKKMILDILRDKGEQDSDGNFILLEKLCTTLDVTVMEAMLLLHEINGNRLDVPEGELYVYAFFNHGSGEVWCELWEPER